MGGYNSGRFGWRGVVERRKRLDIRNFTSEGALARGSCGGTLHWTSDGEEIGSMGFQIESHSSVRLDYCVTDDDGVQHPIRYWLATTRIPCRYGGHRYYWLCPWCSRRCGTLMMAREGREWACRRCLRLRYVSQGLAPAERLQRRADAIYARLGAADTDWVPKPKWMRWRTFNRQMDQANELSSQSDEWFIQRLQRFGFAGFDEALGGLKE